MDLVTSGYAHLYRPRSRENLASARAFFEHALRLDNRCPEGLAGLGQTHLSDTLCLWSHDPAAQVRLADELATRALEIRPKLAYAYHVKGVALRLQWQHERAIAALEMAAQLNPTLAVAHAELGIAKHLIGRGDHALAYAHDGVALARSISPRDPVLANWLFGIGVASLHTGETVEAIR
jgi:tetratricopeptide (TPR) repeat protein